MPAIIPFIPLIAAGAGIGTQVGLAETAGGGGPSQAQLQAQQDAARKAQEDAQRQAYRGNIGNAQEKAGGGLTEDAFANLVKELSGNAGNIDLAKSTIFGTSPGATDQLSQQLPQLDTSQTQLPQNGLASGGTV